MVRKVVKVESGSRHSWLGMVMTAVAAAGAFKFLKNRQKRDTLASKLATAAATVIAAREVLGERANAAHSAAYARVRPTRLGAWLARS